MKLNKLVVAVAGVLLSTAALAADLSHRDKEFIKKATQAGKGEIAAAQVAQTQSSDPKVKAFAQQMIEDHGKAGDELAGIAQSKGVTPPADADSGHRKLAAKLQKLQNEDFDRKYAKEAGVKDHKGAVKLFTDEANKGKDPDLRAFASKTLPTIQHHYEMAQELAAMHK
jgi:putative membrane protein